MLQNDTRAQRDVPGHLTLGDGSADRTVGLWWSSRKAPSWFFHGVFSHFSSFHFSSSHRPSFTYYPVVPFWQIFASNENVQAALSGGETSLSWKVILWRCFLGLCSWFLHISPHLNAGISSAASLGGKRKKKQQKTFNSKIWAYSGFLLCISRKAVFTENGESALKHLLKALYASRILSEPSLLRHRQPACFFSWRGKRDEGRNLGSQEPFLELLLYPPKAPTNGSNDL